MTGDDSSGEPGFVVIRGARQNNLKDVSLHIPRDCLVVFTGVSGSGKSTLAFDTIYAEAQRRYFESVAPYARRLIDQVGVPDVDEITGLPPAVAIQQVRATPSARSTVGSVSQLSSFVRMLYSRAGTYPAGQAMLVGQDFSPNTPQGACPKCHGLGWVYEITEHLMVPDPSLTIREGAVAAWPPAWRGQNFRNILVTLGMDIDRPWRDLPAKHREWILFTDEEPVAAVYPGLSPSQTREAISSGVSPRYKGTFKGARKYVLDTLAQTESASRRKQALRSAKVRLCPLCDGKKLKREALSVKFAGVDIGELGRLSLDQLATLMATYADLHPLSLEGATESLAQSADGDPPTPSENAPRRPEATDSDDFEKSPARLLAAHRMMDPIVARLDTLRDLGLGYLTLDRNSPSLSGGELQRLRLATQIRSNLFGVVYVLDEPTAGLHPADGEALMRALRQIKASGNSLFIVEHDLDVMRQADWIVDVGPDAGEYGGCILYSGPVEGLRSVASSHTARHLFNEVAWVPRTPRRPSGWLKLRGITRNNLHDLNCDIPIGVMTAITGVSGSGKSSLMSHAIVDAVLDKLGSEDPHPAEPESETEPDTEIGPALVVSGELVSDPGAIRRLVSVDQKPIGRTPRSNLATYTGLFSSVRKLFAGTPQARERHFDAGRFSFNVPKGRCPTCEGEGFVTVTLHFMPSVYATCPTCHGARYNPETLLIKLDGKSISEVLELSVEEALLFFKGDESISGALLFLKDVGLGYLKLGQPATELSGGEAQRIKLATELQRGRRGDTLYILDEPSTGLHPADTVRLLGQLERLVEQGNTVVVADHNMVLAASSDWVIDMGPSGGDQGGQIIAKGTPGEVASGPGKTATYLKAILARGHAETSKTASTPMRIERGC